MSTLSQIIKLEKNFKKAFPSIEGNGEKVLRLYIKERKYGAKPLPGFETNPDYIIRDDERVTKTDWDNFYKLFVVDIAKKERKEITQEDIAWANEFKTNIDNLNAWRD